MAQLWGGRFTKQTDEAVKAFNDSIGFDKRLYRQDIEGSLVHARMLGKQGILTAEDCEAIEKGLQGILSDLESGKMEITSEYEDIHSFVEANLIDRIGDAGKRLHTGRSRNDQVALDMRLYTRAAVDEVRGETLKLLQVEKASSISTKRYSLEFQMISSSEKRERCIIRTERSDKNSSR